MADIYYAYMVQFGESKAIVVGQNALSGLPMPMIFGEKEFEKNKQTFQEEMQKVSDMNKITIQLVKFTNIEIVDAYTPQSTILN